MKGRSSDWTPAQLARAGLFAAMTAIGAWISIPMPIGVPLTLQVLFSLLSGVVLGRKAGALSQLIYVFMGCVGLPVFAGRTGGLQELMGPTGGYILGFILAAWIVGRLTENQRQVTGLRGSLAMGAGLIAIYMPGVIVLALHIGSFMTSVVYGMLVYLPLDIMKGVAALAIARGLEHRGIVRAPHASKQG